MIPLFDGFAVFPVIGPLDNERLNIIEERLLDQLENKNLNKIFIDLSGTIVTNDISLETFERVINGITLLGCEAVLTGISAKLAKQLLNSSQNFIHKITVESSLQQALLRAQNALLQTS